MKIKILTIITLFLLAATFSRAQGTADSDGVINDTAFAFQKTGPKGWQLRVDGKHNRFEAGHIQGNLIADADDSSMTLLHSLKNDTSFTWTDYKVIIKLNKSFTLSSVSVGNTDWACSLTQPTQVGSDWVGYIDYHSGTPVAPKSKLDFGYSMTFNGSVSFLEELSPISVPEPNTAVLALCGWGGILTLRYRRQRR